MPAEIELTETITLALYPREEGSIEVTAGYDVPAGLGSLEVTLPTGANPLVARGFESASGEKEYAWDGTTADPAITFAVEADNDSARFGGYSFVDRNSWAITQAPSLTVRWTAAGDADVDYRRRFEVDGKGVASQDGYMVYLGESRSWTVSGQSERFSLVDPAVSDLAPPAVSILGSLSEASETLEVGARSPEVIALAAPEDGAEWGLTTGLQSGDCGFWARDGQRVATPHNTWVHEYVHTRQDFDVSESTKWLVEGSANYYAALLALRQNVTTYDRFHATVSTDKDEHATLADPQTWPSPFTDYKKGMRVLAALDLEVRERSDGTADLQALFRELNAREGTVTMPEVTAILEGLADESISRWVDTYVRSPDSPDVPRAPSRYDRPALVPVSGPQPVCPHCRIEVSGAYCGECGMDLEQRCEGCSAPILGVETFCEGCGRNLERSCDFCGEAVGDREYCPNCGTELEG